jgi:hypothetical protein
MRGMEELPFPQLLAAMGSARISGMLAFAVCLICHQALLFAIGRWTIELDGWRALFTTLAGVAGLSIGSVTLPPLAAPLLAMVAAFITMRYVYEMEAWQQGVMAAAWYLVPLGSLFLAGALFSSPEPPPARPVDRERALEALRRSTEKTAEEAPAKDPVGPPKASEAKPPGGP